MEYKDKGAYAEFGQWKIKKLWSKRNGWFRTTYELIDDTSSYGKLTYLGVFGWTIQIDTADVTWFIRSSGISGAEITTAEGLSVGRLERKWFSSKTQFISEDGFTANFYSPSIWRSEVVWAAKDGQILLTYQGGSFTKKESYTFTDLPNEQPYLLLLAFLTLEFNLRRRRGAAAGAVAATTG